MNVRHDPVVIAEPGHAGVLGGAAIQRAELPDGVAIADLQPGRLAGILLVLRHFADGAELENSVVAADAGMAADDDMGADPGVVADLDMLADHRIRPDLDSCAESRAGMDDGRGMDVHSVERSVHISSASAAICPSTLAVAAYFQMLRLLVRIETSKIN